MFDLIDSQTNLKSLVSVFNRSTNNRNRYFKLNLQNLVYHNSPRDTIEIRSHEGTTDAGEIEIWVRLLVFFTEVAADPKKTISPFKDGNKAATIKKLLGFLEPTLL